MKKIEDKRVVKNLTGYSCNCVNCNNLNTFATKASALRSLKFGVCVNCKVDYRKTKDNELDTKLGIYQNKHGKWCSVCNSCGVEQAYTRKDHARSSSRAKWLCKACACFNNKVRPSFKDGIRITDIDTFERSAESRGFSWEISRDDIVELWRLQEGKCALSGLQMTKHPRTWSIDRINSSIGYVHNNVQLVDKRINMMKGPMLEKDFVFLCKAVADKAKW